MVRETGLEPVRDYHTRLKRARLPIPPLSHIGRSLERKKYYIKGNRQCQVFFYKIFKIFYIELSLECLTGLTVGFSAFFGSPCEIVGNSLSISFDG